MEDSTSGLCHTPGTRAGFTPLVGSNPTSSAEKKSPAQPGAEQGISSFSVALALKQLLAHQYLPERGRSRLGK